LRIVVSCDLGTLGPGESEPILYIWHWHYSVPGLALWAILALAMVVPRANRTWQVLPILAPVLLANLVWLVVAWISGPVTSDRETLGMVVQSLTVGSALLWLLGHVIANYTPRQTMVLALSIALGVAVAGVISVTDVTRRTIALPMLLSFLLPALVLAYTGAAWMSRRTYRPARFLLLLAAWTVMLSALGMPLWFLLKSAVTGNWPTDLLPLMVVFLLAGSISGACVFLVSLSFVLVGLRSPLFRPRLFACLHLSSGPGPAGAALVAEVRRPG